MNWVNMDGWYIYPQERVTSLRSAGSPPTPSFYGCDVSQDHGFLLVCFFSFEFFVILFFFFFFFLFSFCDYVGFLVYFARTYGHGHGPVHLDTTGCCFLLSFFFLYLFLDANVSCALAFRCCPVLLPSPPQLMTTHNCCGTGRRRKGGGKEGMGHFF